MMFISEKPIKNYNNQIQMKFCLTLASEEDGFSSVFIGQKIKLNLLNNLENEIGEFSP